jgi:hypothetical protein
MIQHYAMLQRNLLYTGITRGKKQVVLVGQKKAVDIAVGPGDARSGAGRTEFRRGSAHRFPTRWAGSADPGPAAHTGVDFRRPHLAGRPHSAQPPTPQRRKGRFRPCDGLPVFTRSIAAVGKTRHLATTIRGMPVVDFHAHGLPNKLKIQASTVTSDRARARPSIGAERNSAAKKDKGKSTSLTHGKPLKRCGSPTRISWPRLIPRK